MARQKRTQIVPDARQREVHQFRPAGLALAANRFGLLPGLGQAVLSLTVDLSPCRGGGTGAFGFGLAAGSGDERLRPPGGFRLASLRLGFGLPADAVAFSLHGLELGEGRR